MKNESRIANRESRLRFTLAQLMGAVVFVSVMAWAVFPRPPVTISDDELMRMLQPHLQHESRLAPCKVEIAWGEESR